MTSSNQLPQQPSFKKYWIWLIPFIALLALVSLMKASGSGQTQVAPTDIKKPLVNVMPVQWHEQYVQKHLVVGRVEAPQTAEVGFDLSGSVVNIVVNEGQRVTQGQIMAELDTQRLNAQMTELSAILSRAKSDANLAKLSLKRVIELVDKKLESAQRLDEATESVNAANAFIDEVLARIQRLQVDISKTKLRAPFDGSVVSRLVDLGAVVATGQTLFTLQQNTQLEARFALSAAYADKLVVDQIVEVSSSSTQLLGKIKSIAQQRRVDTRTVDVIVSLTQPNLTILPGDLLNFEMKTSINAEGFWVPRKALVSGVRGLWSLFTVNATGNELQLQAKLVEMLHVDEEQAFVRGALKESDLLVSDGVHRLVPGQKVLLADAQTTNSVSGSL
ncbi:MAG: efflux RND transporter periplasmic adaptor subunit [Paraglaciecola sp.]|uniref:efflux RND transporter periplasmic adaptor subunit n=1 Tax=Paraglaciecola sp. TaxID=1920173 RepID=UPI003299C486